ncbi:MAG: hypothetical protein Q9218_005107 [Villophora microphyllina]
MAPTRPPPLHILKAPTRQRLRGDHPKKKFKVRVSRDPEKNLLFSTWFLITPDEPFGFPKCPFEDMVTDLKYIENFHASMEPAKFRSVGLARRNAVASPFLKKLPLELRQKIYGYVLGDRDIHLVPANRFLHKQPFETYGEDTIQAIVCPSTSSDDHSLCECGKVSDSCQEEYPVYATDERLEAIYQQWLSAERLDMNLLLVCTQVYREVKDVLFGTNRFWYEGRKLTGNNEAAESMEMRILTL